MTDRRYNGRSSLAAIYVQAARVSGVALQGVVPPVLGHWADSSWGTRPWLLIVGGVLGFALFMMELLRLSSGGPNKRK